jgi:hypothetical protein
MKVGRKGYIISEPASCAKLTAPSILTSRGNLSSTRISPSSIDAGAGVSIVSGSFRSSIITVGTIGAASTESKGLISHSDITASSP